MDIGMPKNINIGLSPKIQSSRNSLFEVLLFIIVCGLFFWFIVLPKKSEVDGKATDLAQYTDQESKVADSLKTFNSLVQQLSDNSAAITKLDDAIPLRGKTTYLQLLIEHLANSSGVTIGDVNVSGNDSGVAAGDPNLIKDPFKAQRSLQKLSAAVFVAGSFSQLVSFLQAIETSGRVMQVSIISITPAANNSLSLNTTLQAYYYAP
jgi:Tfp pilus assembly protein PilO